MVIRSFPRTRAVGALSADTRKPTLNQPRESPAFLYEQQCPPPVHIPPDPFISFPQEYDEKGRERGPSPNSKIFHVRPARATFLPNPARISYISRKHSTRNLIQSLTSECRYARASDTHYVLTGFLVWAATPSLRQDYFRRGYLLLLQRVNMTKGYCRDIRLLP